MQRARVKLYGCNSIVAEFEARVRELVKVLEKANQKERVKMSH